MDRMTQASAAPCWADVAWAAWDRREQEAERQAAAENEAVIDSMVAIATGGAISDDIMLALQGMPTDGEDSPGKLFEAALRAAASALAAQMTGAADAGQYTRAGRQLADALLAARLELDAGRA